MLQVTNLNKAFGARDVLRDVTFHVAGRDRIGLVAINGAGKTTLLRIIAGELAPDSGAVSVLNGVQVGYLAQEGHVTPGNTVRQELMAGRPGLVAAMNELAEVEAALAAAPPDDPAMDELVARHGLLLHRFDDLRGYEVETETGIVLHALGFSPEDGERPVETFSGGWQMRVSLGRLLIQRPDLLLLDEPTNHLDMAAVEWLEEYLRHYPGALVIVSHDRYILDRVSTRTLELSGGVLSEYAGNYTAYVAEKARRQEAQAEAYERQQEFISRTQEWIDRFHAKATKASAAQSRAKMLAKLERVEAPGSQKRAMGLRFDAAERSGRVVLEATGITRQFGPLTVLDGVNLEVERGDRIALVGPNGAGKSTLIRLLAGVDQPDGGVVHRGHNVQAAYFAQHQAETLDPTRTVLEELGHDSDLTHNQLRSLLGRFLFSGDDAFKRISVLSGGERARLAFAKMLLETTNLLLLDEPTNHLDIPSQEVLEEALLSYPGAIILASHDRYLIDRIATKVVAVENGGIEVHLGNYTQYRARIQARERAQEAEVKAATVRAQKPDRSPLAQARRDASATRRRVGGLEAEIARLEAEIATLAARLADPDLYTNHREAQATVTRHEECERQLKAALAEWETAAVEVG